jgi:small subunit ribosomal protein S16
MLMLRFARRGKIKQAAFRVIVSEKSKDPWGHYLEDLGFYNPKSKELNLNAERVKFWLAKGAQPSNTLWNKLVDKGIVEGKKRKVSKISQKRRAKIAEEQKKTESVKPQAEAAKEAAPVEAPKAEVPKEAAPAEAPKEEVQAEAPKEAPKNE